MLLLLLRGYDAGGPVVVVPVDRVDVSWSAPRSLLHYNAYPMRLDYVAPKSRTEGEANEP